MDDNVAIILTTVINLIATAVNLNATRRGREAEAKHKEVEASSITADSAGRLADAAADFGERMEHRLDKCHDRIDLLEKIVAEQQLTITAQGETIRRHEAKSLAQDEKIYLLQAENELLTKQIQEQGRTILQQDERINHLEGENRMLLDENERLKTNPPVSSRGKM